MKNQNKMDGCSTDFNLADVKNSSFDDNPDQDNFKELEKQKLQELISQLKTDGKQRKKYAKRAFVFVCSWSTLVFVISFLQGFKLWTFTLNNYVIVTLLTSTFIEVLGLFYFVMAYLFDKNRLKIAQ